MGALQRTSRKATPPTARVGRRGLRIALELRTGLLAAGAIVLLGVLLASAAAPSPAQAISIPNPVSILGGGLGSLLGGAAGPIVSIGVKVFDAIIRHLFAPLAKLVTVALVGWLTAIPNFAQGNVAHLEQTVAAICGGVLGAVATLSVIRYWVAGFAGGGDSGFTALEGLVRTVGAALFIAIWPWLFERAIGLTNLLSGTLLSSGITEKEVANLLGAGLGGAVAVGATSGFTAGFGLFLTIAVAVAASLLFLGLLLLKIVVSISTILLFVGMPFAAVLWPVAPWIGRMVGRAFAVCLVVPVLWALCFAAAAALTADTLTLNQLTGSANGVLNTLLSPLVAIVLLYMMVRLPLHLSRIAMLGGMAVGGGFASRAVSYAAGSQMRDMARQHLPESLGGRSTGNTQSESPLARKIRTATATAGMAATGGTAAGAAGATSSGAGGAGGKMSSTASTAAGGAKAGAAKSDGASDPWAYTPPPLAQAQASAEALQTALPKVPFNEARHLEQMEQAEKTAKDNPVTVGEARAALAELPRDTQQGAEGVHSEPKVGRREAFAHYATAERMRPEERAAWQTLAAATPEVRAQAFEEAKEDGWVTNGATSAFVGADSAGASGSDGSTGASPVSEGHGTDPRPVSDDAPGGVRSGDAPGHAPAGVPETPDVAGADPGHLIVLGVGPGPDRPARRAEPRRTPAAPERTNLRPPPEPRDPASGI